MNAAEESLWLQMRKLRKEWQVEREYAAIAGRKFRWDFAIPGAHLLVEVQGSTWTKGGHSTGRGIQRDYEKLNLATEHGFRSLCFTTEQALDGTALATIERVLES